MICNNCKQSYDDILNACPYCGAAKAVTDNIPPQQYGQVPPQAYQANSPAKGTATGSLVCGIIAIAIGVFVPLAGLILGIIALTLGNKAKCMLPADQRGMATAGFICGIIGIVIAVIFWIINTVVAASMLSYLYY